MWLTWCRDKRRRWLRRLCLYHQLYARNRSEMKKSFLETRLQSLDFGNGTRPNCKRSCQIAVQNGRRRAPPTLPQPPPAAAAAADASTITAWRPLPPHPHTRSTPGTPGLAHGLPPAFPRVCRDSVAKVAAAWVVLRQEGVAAIAAAVAAAFFREN